MAEIPRPPDMTKADLADLQRYHKKLGDYLSQLTDSLGGISFKDNLGALMTEPTAVEVSSYGDFGTSGLDVPCDFEPALVLFKAARLDTNGKPTGEVNNGCVAWRTGTRTGIDGFIAISGSYLTAARYSVTIIAFRG
jgi:hypothetical protein